jgi:hypothetical protein
MDLEIATECDPWNWLPLSKKFCQLRGDLGQNASEHAIFLAALLQQLGGKKRGFRGKKG